MAASENDLERGIRHIRQMDSDFDPVRFSDTASEVFFNIQTAWMARHMEPVRHLLTPEMYEQMQKDCNQLRLERRVNPGRTLRCARRRCKRPGKRTARIS